MPAKPLPHDPVARTLLLNEAKPYLDHHVAMLNTLEHLFPSMPLDETAGDEAWRPFTESLGRDVSVRVRAERAGALLLSVPPVLHALYDYLDSEPGSTESCESEPDCPWPNCRRDPALGPFVRHVTQVQSLYRRLLVPAESTTEPRLDPHCKQPHQEIRHTSVSVSRDPEDPTVTVNGIVVSVSAEQAALVDVLVRAADWISNEEMRARDQLLRDVTRLDRLRDSLPPKVRKLIESERGKGSRIKKVE